MTLLDETIRRTYGAKGETWLAALPQLLHTYLALWKLNAHGEFDNLRFNYVVPVICQDHSLAVLKMGPHRKGRLREMTTLDYYNGQGAVRVLNSAPADGVLLLERASPGSDLSLLDDSTATEIFAGLLRKLQTERHQPPSELSSISIWGLGFEKFLRENRRGINFPKEKIIRADQLFKELHQSCKKNLVLHGDLHHANILQATREPYLAIDPKGLIGDPTFEIGAFIRNPISQLAQLRNFDLDTLLTRRLKTLEHLLDFDPFRMWGWSYSQCILAAIWTATEPDQSWQQWLRVAESLERIEPCL